ncbi:MAG TPA: chemotaxis protein CheB [Gemmatimonadales bacterium]|nr:chemotaxis protein CheB [Gemmatimonadales bacterium]
MAQRDIVVVGASAGGTEALTELVRGLPVDFPAAVFVVVHFPASASSVLPRILSRAGHLPAVHPDDGDTFVPGRIYVARPDCHLTVRDGRLSVRKGPKENNARPAVDPLFRSAARTGGHRVIGVVLSGNLDDGTAGLLSIKQHGGVAVVQSPDSAQYPGMPRSAIDHVAVDYVVPIEQIPALLVELTRGEAGAKELMPMDSDDTMSGDEEALVDRQTQPGTPSTMTCPECHGSLWETREGALVHFRCRVGHAYTAESLLAHQADQLEAALWTALRSLEEHAALSRRLASRASARGHSHSASAFTEQAMDAEHHASTIRNVLATGLNSAAMIADLTSHAAS